MANLQASNQSTDLDPASLEAARDATQSALPFVEWLMQRFSKVVHQIRSGNDVDAMERMAGLSSDLKDFFQYTFLMEDLRSPAPSLVAYRDRLSKLLDSINPALDNLDLVEVADIVEHDVLPALADYGSLHDEILAALPAA